MPTIQELLREDEQQRLRLSSQDPPCEDPAPRPACLPCAVS